METMENLRQSAIAFATDLKTTFDSKLCAYLCSIFLGGNACDCSLPIGKRETVITDSTIHSGSEFRNQITKNQAKRKLIHDDQGHHYGDKHMDVSTTSTPAPTESVDDLCDYLCSIGQGGDACQCSNPALPGKRRRWQLSDWIVSSKW